MLPLLPKSRSACTTRQGAVNPSTVARKSKSCILTTYNLARCHKRCSQPPMIRASCAYHRMTSEEAYGRSEKSRSELRCRVVLCKPWILLIHRLHSATTTDEKKRTNEREGAGLDLSLIHISE